MKIFIGLSFFAYFVQFLVQSSKDSQVIDYFWTNTYFQIANFLLIACIPYLKTGMMKNVDISWPWGLFFMGIFSFYYGTTSFPRKLLISLCYIIQGFRMGAGGTAKILKMKEDFPRYKYVKIIFEQQNIKNKIIQNIYALSDILAQCVGNIGLMSVPILITSFNKDDETYIIEYVLFIIFFLCIYMETKADLQKLKFIIKNKKNNRPSNLVCNYGLWKYSRHPNYFFEWQIWNTYCVWTFINLYQLYNYEMIHTCVFYSYLACIIALSFFIYVFLAIHTGAKPAEYFSLQKRPGYKQYIETTNCIIPWFPKQVKTHKN